MALTPDDLKSLVAAFEASDWGEMSVRLGDTTLELTRTGRPPTTAPSVSAAPAAAPAAPAPVAHAPAPRVLADAAAVVPMTAGTGPDQTKATWDGHLVSAPSLGLFWRSPQPGAPPFVEVGQQVEAGDTVCIVEVMKLMNHVMAGVSGTVIAIEPENGQMVEFGQLLVVIRPDS